MIDWRANARDAIMHAQEWRGLAAFLLASGDFTPEKYERVIQGIGRLVRWADERVR